MKALIDFNQTILSINLRIRLSGIDVLLFGRNGISSVRDDSKMGNKRDVYQMFGLFLAGLFGMGLISSCGNNLADTKKTDVTEQEVENTVLEDTTLPDLYAIERVVNVKEADLTHDGVKDKIVSTICYLNEYEMDGEKTADELMNSYYGVICNVYVYDGNGLTEKEICFEERSITGYLNSGLPIVEYGIKFEGDCIWKDYYAVPHSGNGWLCLATYDGKDYLLDISSSIWQGRANFQYKLFSFTNEYRENVERENNVIFTIDNVSAGGVAFPIDEMIAYTEDLEQQLEGSILLIYTDIEQRARICTFEKESTANAFDAWYWLKKYNDDNDFTIESLRETMEWYYKEEWRYTK